MNEDDTIINSPENSENNAAPMLSSEQMTISFWVINKTPSRFILAGCDLSWGKWSQSPVVIPANAGKMLAFKSIGRMGSATGTEGWVTYASDQRKMKFTIRWNVPYTGEGNLALGAEGEGGADFKFEITDYNRGSVSPSPVLTITDAWRK
jgi:hypothetical protein